MADDFENIKLINNMVNLIERGYNLVVPSRFIPGGKMIGAKKKIIKMITITRFIFNLLLGKNTLQRLYKCLSRCFQQV